MTYKQKLIDLLKSDEQIKTTMEKLEFGCKVNTKNYGVVKMYNLANFLYEDKYLLHNLYTNSGGFEIIGLPLQERFIRMYWEREGENLMFITSDGYLCFSPNELDFEGGYDKSNICLDNTKDFDNQSEETYKQIYLALTNLTNE